MKIKKNIPNLFTSFNLLSGCFGVVAVAENKPESAIIFIFAGAFFDFLDGFFARLLKTGSKIGKELDSLADMITFGLLPAYLIFFILREITTGYYPYVSFVMVAAAGFRLAKFNISEDQKDYFVGLPTPANAFLVAGLVYVYLADWESLRYVFNDPNIIMAFVFIQSFLMNSNIRFLNLKFKKAGWKGNELRYIFLTSAFLFILFFRTEGIFLLMIGYMLLSFYQHLSGVFRSRS